MSEPNFNETPLNKIHPALDFILEHAYVGQRLPSTEPDGSHEDLLYLIKDDRTTIAGTTEALEEHGITLTSTDFPLDPRWSLDSIRRFVEGENAVEPNILFERIRRLFRAYIELSDERLHSFLTLWNIGTYFFPLFNAYPYVYVGGIRGSGKTKLLTLCHCIAFNSIFSGNMSTACVYRLIENGRCSLLIDETEMLSTKYRARYFRNILLSGYRKGSKVYRNRKTPEGNFVPEPFEVYGPKMLANIEGLEEVLRSRCIAIIMQIGLNNEITNREVDINYPIWQQTRDVMYTFLMRKWNVVRQIYSELENDTGLSNRYWELWKPILVLARLFNTNDNHLYENMRDLALEKVAESQSEDLGSHEAVLVEVLLFSVDEDDFYQLARARTVTKKEDT